MSAIKQPSTEIDLMQEQVTLGQQLLDCLKTEFACLQGRDPESLQKAVKAKLNCLTHFNQLDQQRQKLVESGHLPKHPPTRVDQLNPKQTVAADLIESLQILAAECHEQNMINGGVAELGRQHNQRCLDILRGQPQQSGVYGRGGEADREVATQQLAIA